jgi:hypothetical protein
VVKGKAELYCQLCLEIKNNHLLAADILMIVLFDEVYFAIF